MSRESVSDLFDFDPSSSETRVAAALISPAMLAPPRAPTPPPVPSRTAPASPVPEPAPAPDGSTERITARLMRTVPAAPAAVRGPAPPSARFDPVRLPVPPPARPARPAHPDEASSSQRGAALRIPAPPVLAHPDAASSNERIAAALRAAPPPPPPPPPSLAAPTPEEPELAAIPLPDPDRASSELAAAMWLGTRSRTASLDSALATLQPPRPAQVSLVMAVFALSLVFTLFGPVCWKLAAEELRGIDHGTIAPRGRRWLVLARTWGIFVTFLLLVAAGVAIGFVLPFLL